jgi:3-oxoacyl-[acyl-carrier protein] reductase
MALEGRTVLVTGGSGQLGRVIVRQFIHAKAGVFVAAKGPVPHGAFDADIAGDVRVLEGNVTDEGDVASVFDSARKLAGEIDILVNCAGAFAATGPVAETDAKEWDRMIAVNLRSVFLCARAFILQKKAGGYGRIISFSAQTVFRGSAGRAAYAVAKGGVATLTGLLGEELRGSGITANAIAPSIIRTPENLKAMPGADASAWVDPEEIASEVLHLCAPSAGAINGAIIPMFGGVRE